MEGVERIAHARVDEEATRQSRRSTLKELLPPRRYAQWRALRNKYLGSDAETDRLLPAAAALLLQARAFEQSGLTYSDAVWRKIYEIAGQRGIPVWPQSYDTKPVESRRTAGRIATVSRTWRRRWTV